MKKEIKKILLLVLVGVILVSGCSSPRTNRQNFYFNDTNNSIENDKICFELCKSRETECFLKTLTYFPFICAGTTKANLNNTITCCESTGYRCDYDPVICDKGICECKTW